MVLVSPFGIEGSSLVVGVVLFFEGEKIRRFE